MNKRVPVNDKKEFGARRVALDILMKVVTEGSYADVLLSKRLTDIGLQVERNLATELVYGVLRWQIKIDWIIALFSDIKIAKLEHRVLNALRLGIYQLFFLDKIPSRAAVFETVELLRADKKKAGFVNAVLRSAEAARQSVNFPLLKREPVKYISVVFSHPEWMVERWIKRYGIKEAIELCQANLRRPRLTLRVNTLKLTRDELLSELTKADMDVAATRFSPEGVLVKDAHGNTLLSDDERFYIQDEASQLVAHLVSPKRGEKILDACAAPGGKATHMAELMENDGVVYAVDKVKKRLHTLERLAKKHGINIIETKSGDAVDLELHPSLFSESSNVGADEGLFDAVLVDAPCTGLGVLGRTPDIKLNRRVEDISNRARLQKMMLQKLSGYVRAGGRLVYSVCSIEPEEGEEVAEGFIEKNKDFKLVDSALYLPKGLGEMITSEGYLKSLPHRDGTDGFFAARFERI
jgi:16S rRNA (cytosine967-C5)-methyltransferase